MHGHRPAPDAVGDGLGVGDRHPHLEGHRLPVVGLELDALALENAPDRPGVVVGDGHGERLVGSTLDDARRLDGALRCPRVRPH
jgi:hypothetical protein